MEVLWAWLVLLVWPPDACTVVEAIDVLRADAWVRDDVEQLAGLYATPEAGRDDVALLRRYDDRNVRLSGVRMIRSSCTPRGPDRVEVVERLGPTVAHLPDGTQRRLPQDSWNRRTITVAHVDGHWRIREVH